MTEDSFPHGDMPDDAPTISPARTKTGAARPFALFDPAQFVAFCCVGVANTLLDFLVYLAASSFLPLALSRVLSWAAACAFSYAVNKRWVFQHTEGGGRPATRFIIVNLCSLLLGVGILTLLNKAGWGRISAYVAGIPAITLSNYFGYKLWSFRQK